MNVHVSIEFTIKRYSQIFDGVCKFKLNSMEFNWFRYFYFSVMGENYYLGFKGTDFKTLKVAPSIAFIQIFLAH